MGYVGVPPQSGFITTAKQRVTGSTNNYVDLDHSISSLADIIVWVNFVKQDSTNLTLTTSSRITLGATLVASDIVEIAYLGKAVATQTPSSGTVTSDMLAGSIANSKLANSSITLNGSAVSLGGSATVGGNSKLFEGTFGSQTSGTISLSSIGFIPNAVHCIFCPNDTTNATDVDNISMGFGVKTGATSSDMAVAYNYYQQSGTSAFDANPNVIGRLAFGSAAFHELTITGWGIDDCTLTKTVLNTPANVTLKYAIMVTG